MLNSTWLFCRCASLCTKGRAASSSLKQLQNKSLGQCYLSCGVRSRVSNRMGQSPDVPGQARTVQSQNFPGCPRTKQVRVVLLSLLLMKKKIVSPCTFIPDKLLCPGMSWGKITTSLSNKMLKIKSRLLFFFLYFFPSVLCPVPAHSVAKFQSPVSAWLPPTPQQRSRYSRPSGGRYECAPRDRGQNTRADLLASTKLHTRTQGLSTTAVFCFRPANDLHSLQDCQKESLCTAGPVKLEGWGWGREAPPMFNINSKKNLFLLKIHYENKFTKLV